MYITTSVSLQLFEGSSKVSTNCSGRILVLLTIAFFVSCCPWENATMYEKSKI